MKPAYAPPYDSPLEDLFAHNAVKYVGIDVQMYPQYSVGTLCGRFILDFVFVSPSGRRVGIECDGREFHNPRRDEWRDAMILGERHVDAIYRLRGSDLTLHTQDLFYVIAHVEPEIIPERSMRNLQVIATSYAKLGGYEKGRESYRVLYRDFGSGKDANEDDEEPYIENEYGEILLEARYAEPKPLTRAFWQAAYRFAVSVGGGQLDDVIRRYEEEASNHSLKLDGPDGPPT